MEMQTAWSWVSAAVLCAFAGGVGASFPDVECVARNTAGFHDYEGGAEDYEASVFHPGRFALSENVFLMNNLSVDDRVQLYLTMTDTDGEVTELECRTVRGAGAQGYSCVNIPPSELLLINGTTLRFTRTSVGGWTFAGASENLNGDSIFIEYGQCLDRGGG
ncbi:MAG: hypothetical protein QF921_00505 [Pseudomonadales bacterium]|nr:hypothetical protein [Pseudomonadales bacterium]MDP6969997.1 hypothetical protein [Pseudomonadales bacterium]